MWIKNNKPIITIGFLKSAMTQDLEYFLYHYDLTRSTVLEPNEFYKQKNKHKYQYFLGFSLDMEERKKVCDVLENENLDCVSYISEQSFVAKDFKINKGLFIAPFSTVMQGVKVGSFSLIETYCLVSHYSSVGSNCVIHSGAMIGGKTKVGNNCVLGFKSSIINNVTVTDNVSLGAFSNITKDALEPGFYVGTLARKR